MPPIHPGETLREDFLKPLGLSADRLATELFVPATRVNDIVRCRRAITADTALRLARYFGTTPLFWINLQSSYDLELAQDTKGYAVRRMRLCNNENTKRVFAATVRREGDWYISQCLEVDVASQGETEPEAWANLKGALELHFEPPQATRPAMPCSVEVGVGAA